MIVAAHNLPGTNHIYKFGTPEQRKKFVTPLAQGKKLGCWSLTEPQAGSDAGGTRTVAARKDGGWILNGSKTFITNGHYADVCVAMAVTDKPKGTKGISALIVEKGNPGFRAGKKENKLGMRASDTSEVIFSDCFVPDENLLGKEGLGFVNTLQVLDGGRISISALALGMAQGAYEAAAGYAKQRKQFGKAISEFQAIQFKLADMATEIDAARCWSIAPPGLRLKKVRDSRKNPAWRNCTPVKSGCAWPRGGANFGGYGFRKDYPVEKFYRDSKLCTIGEGTSEIQRMVIARQILDAK